MRKFSVRDRNGDQLTVYEFQDQRYLKKVRRLTLCTGEPVKIMNDELVVIGTGERLTPV